MCNYFFSSSDVISETESDNQQRQINQEAHRVFRSRRHISEDLENEHPETRNLDNVRDKIIQIYTVHYIYWAAMSSNYSKETHFKRDMIVSCLFLPVSSIVLGDDHRRGSQRQHGPVSARPVLCFDTTTSGDTSYPGVLRGFESEAVSHSWYQWWSARAQLCSGGNSIMQVQWSKFKSLKYATWLVFGVFFPNRASCQTDSDPQVWQMAWAIRPRLLLLLLLLFWWIFLNSVLIYLIFDWVPGCVALGIEKISFLFSVLKWTGTVISLTHSLFVYNMSVHLFILLLACKICTCLF